MGATRSDSIEVLLGARDGLGARVGVGVGQVLGQAVLGHPAGDALAHFQAQLLLRLIGVLADLAMPGDRCQLDALDGVDADVVVVDQLVQLAADGQADLTDLGQPREARSQLLDRLELGGPGGRLGVVPGVGDGDAGLRREGVQDVQLGLVPGMSPVVIQDQQAQALPAAHERCSGDRVQAFLEDEGPAVVVELAVRPVVAREGPMALQRSSRQAHGRRPAHGGQEAFRQAT